MAIEFGGVNAIQTSAVDTPILWVRLSRAYTGIGSLDERPENLVRNTVSGKLGTPDEIAQSIFFLSDGPQSSFMTGQEMIVDGGATPRLSTE